MANRQKEIEAKYDDPMERGAHVSEETSNDGRFSDYEYAPKKDPRDGDLVLQYRGAPKK